ncbi:MAG: fibronectin type III domain-containing protein [Spirochaetota bacterium]|nr:fibronectin type III domain-containing protein [Spirochaetota bacterium]
MTGFIFFVNDFGLKIKCIYSCFVLLLMAISLFSCIEDDEEPPLGPTNLQAEVISYSKVVLTWEDNSSNDDGFKVERAPDVDGIPGDFRRIVTVGVGITSFANTELQPETCYHYRVRAFNTKGNSEYSNEVSVTTCLKLAAIIVGHTCTDISGIPEYWIDKAKKDFRLSYGHTSYGSQIISGMNLLKDDPGSLYWFDHDGTEGGLSLHDEEPSGDLGDPNRTEWAIKTMNLLNAPENDRNMIMWSWSSQADTSEENIDLYLELMDQLEIEFPGVTFVYMTGHLNGTGEAGVLHRRNEQIRNFCEENHKVLFDFADIESYDPDGNYFLDLRADEECDYDNGNWADEWCIDNSDECDTCSCAHSHCLNCQLKGRAFWWMMARIAGWDGQIEE